MHPTCVSGTPYSRCSLLAEPSVSSLPSVSRQPEIQRIFGSVILENSRIIGSMAWSDHEIAKPCLSLCAQPLSKWLLAFIAPHCIKELGSKSRKACLSSLDSAR